MVSRIWCWEPDLSLDPAKAEFELPLAFLRKNPLLFQPSQGMLRFIHALTERFPDGKTTKETVWAITPLRTPIAGRFVELCILRSKYKAV